MDIVDLVIHCLEIEVPFTLDVELYKKKHQVVTKYWSLGHQRVNPSLGLEDECLNNQTRLELPQTKGVVFQRPTLTLLEQNERRLNSEYVLYFIGSVTRSSTDEG